MNDLERFLAVINGEDPDYIPIIGLPGAAGMSGGCLSVLHRRLVSQGMPSWVDGSISLSKSDTIESWGRYWGTTVPMKLDFAPHEPAVGFKTTRRESGGFEIIESESGAVTRQYIDNDENYVMPDHEVYPVRDRASWEFFRERVTPGRPWSSAKIDEYASKYDGRTKPLVVTAGGTWGSIRSSMGTELACTILYDDPEWVHEIMDWKRSVLRSHVFPLIERLRPEIIHTGEDICYKGGMLISPDHWREFCAPFYIELSDFARSCGCPVIALDNDGNANEFVSLLEECGVNAMYPFEPKAGNELFTIRDRHPEFLLFGWLEKEVVNEGNEHLIEDEIRQKAALLEKGRYFPNLEHGMQPMATFDLLLRFMTLLHEITGNPEGEFPRIDRIEARS
jgi:hypothetical protein